MLGGDLTRSTSERLAKEYAEKYNIPSFVVFAVIEQESAWDQLACRYEEKFIWIQPHGVISDLATKNRISYATEKSLQKHSFGLMQIMGSTIRDLGWKGSLLHAIYDPALGLDLGCQFLRRQYLKYRKWPEAFAAYNAGSARYVNGRFINQEYVDSVLKKLEKYKSILTQED